MGTMSSNPNIILIWCDQLRADSLGCMGHPLVKTPNTDALAAGGSLFTNCMITAPTCTPSRASVLTGCYASAIRSRMVGCVTPEDERFLPRVLRSHGYHTASIGKIHLAPQGEEMARIEATREDDLSHGAPRYDYHGFSEIDLVNGHGDSCYGHYSTWLEEQGIDADALRRQRQDYPHGIKATYSYELPPHAHSSNYIGRRVEQFLRREHEDPFFLHVSFPDPHEPFCVPEPYASMYDLGDIPDPIPVPEQHPTPYHRAVFHGEHRGSPHAGVGAPLGTNHRDYSQFGLPDYRQMRAIYYGMITLIDENVGRIMQSLRETGRDQDTIVAFLSDHGDYLGDYGLQGKGFHYDCITRTPLIVAGPGLPRDQRIDAVTSTLDLAPTLLDLVGVAEPEAVQGISMKPTLLSGEPPARIAALTENDDDMGGVRFRTLRTDRWKLTHYLNQDFGELYDLRADPHETRNLWADSSLEPVRTRLTAVLLDEVLCGIDLRNGRIQKPRPLVAKWHASHQQE